MLVARGEGASALYATSVSLLPVYSDVSTTASGRTPSAAATTTRSACAASADSALSEAPASTTCEAKLGMTLSELSANAFMQAPRVKMSSGPRPVLFCPAGQGAQ